MNIIARLLRTPEPASADLRHELAGLDIPGKAAAVERLRARRRQQLLDVEDSTALDATERELTEAQREHDRAVAQHEELSARLEIAVQRERIDALEARKAEVLGKVEGATRAMQRFYPNLIDDLAALVRQDREAREAVDSVNAALAAVGSTERVPSPPPPPVKIMDRIAELVPGGFAGVAG